MRTSLLASTGSRDTDEAKRRTRSVNVLCDEILETMPCRHGNVGIAKIQASKLLTAKLDCVQLPKKIETNRARYNQLADGRDYDPEMKCHAPIGAMRVSHPLLEWERGQAQLQAK